MARCAVIDSRHPPARPANNHRERKRSLRRFSRSALPISAGERETSGGVQRRVFAHHSAQLLLARPLRPRVKESSSLTQNEEQDAERPAGARRMHRGESETRRRVIAQRPASLGGGAACKVFTQLE